MRYKSIDPDLFRKNREKLEKKLKPNALAVIHANDEMPRNGDQCFVYRQNSDLFYLTGLDQEKCILTLFPNHPVEAMREIVFTVRTNDRMVTWYGHKYTLEQVTEISGVKNVRWLDDFEDTFRDLMARAEFVYLNQNENPRFTTEVPSRDLRFMQQLRHDYPLHAL